VNPLRPAPRGPLGDAVRVVAEICADGPGADWLAHPFPLAISERAVDAETTLTMDLAPEGGQVIRLRPAP